MRRGREKMIWGREISKNSREKYNGGLLQHCGLVLELWIETVTLQYASDARVLRATAVRARAVTTSQPVS